MAQPIVKRTYIESVELVALVSFSKFYYKLHLFIKQKTPLFTGKNGIAINLVDSNKSMEVCEAIERHFSKRIYKLDAENADEIEKIQS